MNKIKERLAAVRSDKDYCKMYGDKFKKFWGTIISGLCAVFKAVSWVICNYMFSREQIRNNWGWMILCFCCTTFLFFCMLKFIKSETNVVNKSTLNSSLHIEAGFGGDKTRERKEQAYMHGQIDALKGDIKIKKEDGYWVYKKTPWENRDKMPGTKIKVEENERTYK